MKNKKKRATFIVGSGGSIEFLHGNEDTRLTGKTISNIFLEQNSYLSKYLKTHASVISEQVLELNKAIVDNLRRVSCHFSPDLTRTAVVSKNQLIDSVIINFEELLYLWDTLGSLGAGYSEESREAYGFRNNYLEPLLGLMKADPKSLCLPKMWRAPTILRNCILEFIAL